MSLKFLKPVPGLVVPDPERGHAPLAADGRNVEMTTYWQRRLDEGDVTEVDAQPTAAPAVTLQPEQGQV